MLHHVLDVVVTVIVLVYVLLLLFVLYAEAEQTWPHFNNVEKALFMPVIVVYGAFDVLFNGTVGTVLFLEIPHTVTFSDRLRYHYMEMGWRGKLARVFGHVLNTFWAGYIH